MIAERNLRHNGVILEPNNPEEQERIGDEDDVASHGSSNHSRSGTPGKGSSNNMGATTSVMMATTAPVQTMLVRPETIGPSSGATSYYRQHTTISPGSYGF